MRKNASGRRAAAAQLLAEVAERGAKDFLKPMANSMVKQAVDIASNYATTRLLEGLSQKWYKKNDVSVKPIQDGDRTHDTSRFVFKGCVAGS